MKVSRQQDAFSMIELVIGLMILAVILGAISVVVHTGFQQLTFSDRTRDAYALAELYMEEILATGRWDELTDRTPAPGGIVWPESRATIGAEESGRSQFDDCDDYHGQEFFAPHVTRTGNPLGERFNPFRAMVDVRFTSADGQQSQNEASSFKQIRITVLWGTNQQIELNTILANI